MIKKIIFLMIAFFTYLATSVSVQAQVPDQIVSLIEEALTYADDSVISLGYIEDGRATYYVYQGGQSVKEGQVFDYEVGSITKTVTGAMVARAVDDGVVQLDQPINHYMPSLEPVLDYPTVRQLLIHRSGYPTLFDNDIILENLRLSRNPYHGVTKEILMTEATENLPKATDDPNFEYSNVNASLLGLVLEGAYQESYADLAADFIAEELGLNHTSVFQGTAELGNHWQWSEEDAYAPAGAMVSNIVDMLSYSQIQLQESTSWLVESHQLLDSGNSSNSDTRLRTDSVAYHWLYDDMSEVYWHDGGTGGYTSYIGFNLNQQKAVVVLSNVPMDAGIPASIIGSQMLEEMLRVE